MVIDVPVVKHAVFKLRLSRRSLKFPCSASLKTLVEKVIDAPVLRHVETPQMATVEEVIENSATSRRSLKFQLSSMRSFLTLTVEKVIDVSVVKHIVFKDIEFHHTSKRTPPHTFLEICLFADMSNM